MRVCFVSKEFPPETGWGGIGSYLWDLSHGLVGLGHSVDVICHGTEKERNACGPDLRIHRISHDKTSLKAVPRRLRGFPITLSHLAWSFAAYRYIRCTIGIRNVDLIEVPETNADGYFLRNLKIPLVVKLHTPHRLHYVLNGYRDGFDVKLDDWFGRQTVLGATAVMSCSNAMKELVVESWGLKDKPVCVVHNPVNTDQFAPQPTDPLPSRVVIGYFGRLEQRKGVDILIRAFCDYAVKDESADLYLYGSDCHNPDTGKMWSQYIREFAESKGLSDRVHLVGFISRDELPARYSQCDVAVIPSKQFENFPYTCLEAMACGTPVIASKCGGLPEMVEDGISGLLVEPNNVDALVEAFDKLLTNQEERTRYSKNARKRAVDSFSTEVITRQTIKIYERALSDARNAPDRA